ncbi:MAG: hypothetical protein LBB08_01230, partial [Rickettsiales bacterium]|nr:hypothetical protein [Rickettsiales bacterium]
GLAVGGAADSGSQTSLKIRWYSTKDTYGTVEIWLYAPNYAMGSYSMQIATETGLGAWTGHNASATSAYKANADIDAYMKGRGFTDRVDITTTAAPSSGVGFKTAAQTRTVL